MKILRDPTIAPPGGWRWVDPDSGFPYVNYYRSESELLEHVRTYRSQNSLPEISDLRFQVENWICCQPNTERFCIEAKDVRRTGAQYLAGGIAAIKATLRGDEGLCPQDVAEARAKICVTCPYNVFNKRHSRMERYTNRYAKKLVGDRKTPLDNKLFTCEICTCPLRPKVHFAEDIIQDALNEKELSKLPVFCWQLHPVKEPPPNAA